MSQNYHKKISTCLFYTVPFQGTHACIHINFYGLCHWDNIPVYYGCAIKYKESAM